MAIVEKGFEMTYKVYSIRSVKVTESGDFNGNKYGASIKLRTLNIEQVEDKDLGFIDKEIILEIKINCPNSTQADLKKYNLFFRGLDLKSNPLVIIGGLPRPSGKDSFDIVSFLTAEEIIQVLTSSSRK